jgi:hypothetical protein
MFTEPVLSFTGMVDVCICAFLLLASRIGSSLVGHSRRPPLQFFAYLAFVFASALIVLRMWVPRVRLPSRSVSDDDPGSAALPSGRDESLSP